jgi:hypothetical protein
MIQLDGAKTAIRRATIFEDKCSEDPRRVFRDEIMDAFRAYHKKLRASELLATAAALLEKTDLSGTKATEAAARVLDLKYRAYRGSLAITPQDDSQERRNRLFRDYEELDGIASSQRIGGVLVTGANLREWFDGLAERAVAYIKNLGSGAA